MSMGFDVHGVVSVDFAEDDRAGGNPQTVKVLVRTADGCVAQITLYAEDRGAGQPIQMSVIRGRGAVRR